MSLSRRNVIAGAAMLALAGSPSLAAPSSSLIDAHWQMSGTAAAPDHSAWTGLLSQYVREDASGVNLVDYAGLAGAGRGALNQYVSSLESATPSKLSRDAAMAYWINLYNAKTVQLVAEAFPVSSIKKVKGGLFGSGPWNEKVSTVEGRALSLNDIEHGILRPIWNDARIHYAVNCASIGCPNLAATAYTAANLEVMLDTAARDYVNHPRAASVQGDKLRVSSIYDWYEVDFGNSDSGVIAHLKQYAGPQLSEQLAGVTKISGDDYDWSLNGI